MNKNAVKTFNFELVSPERRLLSEPAAQVTIPGEVGEFTVLPLHSSLVATVKAGVVTVHGENGEEPRKIFINGGFADVSPENCTILAEEAVAVEDLDAEALGQQASDLTEDIKAANDTVEKARFSRQLHAVQAKLDAVKNYT